MKLRRGEKALRAVHPNAGIAAAYRKKIEALIDEMARSYYRWLRAAYRANPPRMAQDATPASELKREIGRLGKQWQDKLDETAPRLARWFAQSSSRRSDRVLQEILKDSGFSIQFKLTPEVRDILDATVAANVSLIRSIPEQFHTQVEGMVMRSVTTGRDLEQLTNDLQHQFGVTRRRAKKIAIDQNNKATGAIQRARQLELGIEEAIWMHSHAGKKPRPTHVANDGKRYNIRTGWFDPDPKVRKHIWPGELIECKCTSRPVVKGFT